MQIPHDCAVTDRAPSMSSSILTVLGICLFKYPALQVFECSLNQPFFALQPLSASVKK